MCGGPCRSRAPDQRYRPGTAGPSMRPTRHPIGPHQHRLRLRWNGNPADSSRPTRPRRIGVYGASSSPGNARFWLPSFGVHRPGQLALRPGRKELPQHHAAPRRGPRCPDRGGRPAGVPDPCGSPRLEDLLHWVDLDERHPDRTAGSTTTDIEGSTTWHGFASAILARRAPGVEVRPVPTSAFPTKARRPAYSKLDERPFFEALGRESVTWEAALESCLGATFPD